MGRPPKTKVEAAIAPDTKKARVTKLATKPRKRRGITMLEVPDKHARMMENYLNTLIAADEAPITSEASPGQSNEVAPDPLEEEESTDVGDGANGNSEMDGLTKNQPEAYETQEMEGREQADAMTEAEMAVSSNTAHMANGDQEATPSIGQDLDGSPIEGRTEDITESAIIHQHVEIEVEEASDELQGTKHSNVLEIQVQQEEIVDENFELPDQTRDEPHCTFDETDDGPFLGQSPAAVNVPVAQIVPATTLS
jgi:hypothetical protein